MNSTNEKTYINSNKEIDIKQWEFLLYFNSAILIVKMIYQVYSHIKTNSKNNQLSMQSDVIKRKLSKINPILKTLIRNNLFQSNNNINNINDDIKLDIDDDIEKNSIQLNKL